jgi:hypothetical protein
LKFTQVLNDQDSQILFGATETLITLSGQILQMWESRDKTRDNAVVLAEVFMDIVPFLKIFKTYIVNHPKAVEKLEELKKNPKFTEALKRCEMDPDTKGRNLPAFLIQPIQRICRYPLLFAELLKHVEDSGTADKLTQTKVQIDGIVQYLNEGKRESEKQDYMVELQNALEGYKGDFVTATRRFVRQGNLIVRERGEEKAEPSLHVILCNDLLVVTKQKVNPKTNKPVYEFRKEIDLTNPFMRLIAVGDEFKGGKTAFLITTEKQSFCFFATNVDEKESWMKDIRDQKKDTIKRLTSNMQEYRKSVKLNAAIVGTQPSTQQQPQQQQGSATNPLNASARMSKNTMMDEYEQLLNELEGNSTGKTLVSTDPFIDQLENILK